MQKCFKNITYLASLSSGVKSRASDELSQEDTVFCDSTSLLPGSIPQPLTLPLDSTSRQLFRATSLSSPSSRSPLHSYLLVVSSFLPQYVPDVFPSSCPNLITDLFNVSNPPHLLVAYQCGPEYPENSSQADVHTHIELVFISFSFSHLPGSTPIQKYRYHTHTTHTTHTHTHTTHTHTHTHKSCSKEDC